MEEIEEKLQYLETMIENHINNHWELNKFNLKLKFYKLAHEIGWVNSIEIIWKKSLDGFQRSTIRYHVNQNVKIADIVNYDDVELLTNDMIGEHHYDQFVELVVGVLTEDYMEEVSWEKKITGK